MWLAAIFSLVVEHWPGYSKVKGSNPATGMDKMEKSINLFYFIKKAFRIKITNTQIIT